MMKRQSKRTRKYCFNRWNKGVITSMLSMRIGTACRRRKVKNTKVERATPNMLFGKAEQLAEDEELTAREWKERPENEHQQEELLNQVENTTQQHQQIQHASKEQKKE